MKRGPLFLLLMALGVAVFFAVRRDPRPSTQAYGIAFRSREESDFTCLYADEAKAALPGAKITVSDRLQVQVELADGNSLTCNLDNAWAECEDHPMRRAAVRARYLKSFLESIKQLANDTDTAKIEAVMPLVKDSTYLAAMKDLKPVSEPIAGDLHIVYAFNMNKGFRFMGEADLKKLNVSLAELHQRAIQNFQVSFKEVHRQGESPAYLLTIDGNLDASLLLLDKVWDEQAKVVEGDVVAAVPSRSTLLFTGEKSADGIAKIRAAVEEVQQTGDHLVSKGLFVRRNGKWQVF